MKSAFKQFFQRWLINTLAILVAAYFIDGMHYEKPQDLVVATLVLALLNAFLRPFLLVLSLPLLVLTLGLFTLVINAGLLLLVSWMLKPHFYVEGFGTALLGAVVIALISVILNIATGLGDSRVQVDRRPPPPPDAGPGNGPVIDV